MGDVHPLGNPHYWLDPENGQAHRQAIQDKLSELRRAERRRYFAQRYADFDRRLARREALERAMAPYKGRRS